MDQFSIGQAVKRQVPGLLIVTVAVDELIVHESLDNSLA